MSEFGHFGAIGNGIRLDSWGAGPFIIVAENGKKYRFEDSDRFGPVLVRRDGSEAAAQPGARSPFWFAHARWRKQGRKLADDGVTCIADLTKRPTLCVKLGGRNAYVVEDGDEDGGFLMLPPDDPRALAATDALRREATTPTK